MSFFSNIFAGQFNGWKSFLPDILFRDFTHASKVFADERYALAPKLNFLYYIDIQLNPAALTKGFTSNEQIKLNMLVKRATLPSYDLNLDEKNAYNRHTYAYKRMKYQPVDIEFHDDNSDIVNSFWASYYAYMIQDSRLGAQKFVADKHLERKDYSFGIDNTQYAKLGKEGLFTINMYLMNRRKFVGIKLINPRIDNFKHDQVSSDGTSTLKSTMRVVYEAVEYSKGNVSFGNPRGFATLKYDQEPSPLKLPGKSITGILGAGGLLDTGASIFDDIAEGNYLGALLRGGSVVKAVQQGGLKSAFKAEAAGLVTGVLTGKNPLDSIAPSVTGLFAPSANSATPSLLPGTSSQGSVPRVSNVDNVGAVNNSAVVTPNLLGSNQNITGQGANIRV